MNHEPRPGKRPVIGDAHGRRPEAGDPDLRAALSALPVADLSDLVGRLHTMTPEIRPLHTAKVAFAGTAVTVRTPRGDNLAVKQAVDLLKPGDVLVIDAQGFTGWCSGGFNMLGDHTEPGGLAGLVVDGAYRDVAQFEAAGIPLHAVAATPATGPKLGPGQLNVAVSCGHVIVAPGDLIVGDPDGIAVVPQEDWATVWSHHLDRRKRT